MKKKITLLLVAALMAVGEVQSQNFELEGPLLWNFNTGVGAASVTGEAQGLYFNTYGGFRFEKPGSKPARMVIAFADAVPNNGDNIYFECNYTSDGEKWLSADKSVSDDKKTFTFTFGDSFTETIWTNTNYFKLTSNADLATSLITSAKFDDGDDVSFTNTGASPRYYSGTVTTLTDGIDLNETFDPAEYDGILINFSTAPTQGFGMWYRGTTKEDVATKNQFYAGDDGGGVILSGKNSQYLQMSDRAKALKSINRIRFWAGGNSFGIASIYLVKKSQNTTMRGDLFCFYDGNFNKDIFYNEDPGRNNFVFATKTLTLRSWGAAAGWDKFHDPIDMSDYNYLTFSLQEALDYEPTLRIFRQGKISVTQYIESSGEWSSEEVNVDEFTKPFPSGQKVVSFDLSDENWNYEKNTESGGTVHKVSLTHNDIRRINLWQWVEGDKTIKLDTVFLSKEAPVVRANTAANKYGTICLPFASIVPSNTKVYNVVGINKYPSPDSLYLEEVNAMVAGKAYIFKTTNANDVLFVKANTATNLEDPITATNLIGSFSDVSVTKNENNYILKDGLWKLVTGDNAKIAANRAYLKLTANLEIPAAEARRYIVMSFDENETTGIKQVNHMTASPEDSYTYDLQGRKLMNGQLKKGIYIQNGKKIYVKK